MESYAIVIDRVDSETETSMWNWMPVIFKTKQKTGTHSTVESDNWIHKRIDKSLERKIWKQFLKK